MTTRTPPPPPRPHLVPQANLVPVVEDGRPRQRQQQQLVQLNKRRPPQRGQVTPGPSRQAPGQPELAVGRVQQLDGLRELCGVPPAGPEDSGDQQVHAGGVEEDRDVLGRGTLGDANQDSGGTRDKRYQRTRAS